MPNRLQMQRPPWIEKIIIILEEQKIQGCRQMTLNLFESRITNFCVVFVELCSDLSNIVVFCAFLIATK